MYQAYALSACLLTHVARVAELDDTHTACVWLHSEGLVDPQQQALCCVTRRRTRPSWRIWPQIGTLQSYL